MRSVLVPMVACLLLWTAPCAAALYEFMLEGVVTRSFLPDVHVGDTAAMSFFVDDQDLDPSPIVGRYLAISSVTIDFPKTSLVAGGHGGGHLRVSLHNADSVQYQNLGPEYSLNIPLQFPDGTITSDELPRSLPLSLANNNSFQIFPIFTDVVYGRVTSYSATPVPEPLVVFELGTMMLMLGRLPRPNSRAREAVRRESPGGRKRGRDSLALNGYDCSTATGM